MLIITKEKIDDPRRLLNPDRNGHLMGGEEIQISWMPPRFTQQQQLPLHDHMGVALAIYINTYTYLRDAHPNTTKKQNQRVLRKNSHNLKSRAIFLQQKNTTKNNWSWMS